VSIINEYYCLYMSRLGQLYTRVTNYLQFKESVQVTGIDIGNTVRE